MTGCALCDRRFDELYSDDRCFVTLHDDSAVAGHAMVVWRAHVENVADLGEGDALHLMRVWRIAERALLDVTGLERSIVMKLGIQTPHLHIHLYPVAATRDRESIFEAIDLKVREARPEGFAEAVREAIRTAIA